MSLAADLSAIFAGDFAREFTHLETGAVFPAIFGAVDQQTLDGYAITTEFELHYQTASITLADGDRLVDSGGEAVAAGTAWIVRGAPMRLNDGLESSVLLSRT